LLGVLIVGAIVRRPLGGLKKVRAARKALKLRPFVGITAKVDHQRNTEISKVLAPDPEAPPPVLLVNNLSVFPVVLLTLSVIEALRFLSV